MRKIPFLLDSKARLGAYLCVLLITGAAILFIVFMVRLGIWSISLLHA